MHDQGQDMFWQDLPLAAEMGAAVTAVRQAARLCRAVQAEFDPGAVAKADRSPVTVADFGSQALICRALAAAFPGDPVIGEEDAATLQTPGHEAQLSRVVRLVQAQAPEADPARVCGWIDRGSTKRHSRRYWTLDPIDGTKGFLRDGQYAIALALVCDGRLELAVLGCPSLGPKLDGPRGDGTLTFAIRGHGAWEMPLLGPGEARRLTVSRATGMAELRCCESLESAHSDHSHSARLTAEMGITAAPLRLDSQAKYAVVARGEAEVYLRLPRDRAYREKIWDHGAGVLCVTEAGGRVTDVLGRDLDFAQGYRLEKNLGVVASHGPRHDDVLRTLAAQGVGHFPDDDEAGGNRSGPSCS